MRLRRTVALAVTLLLLAWGAHSFTSRLARLEPEIGVEWIDTPRGAVADWVVPREPGWRAGLRPGDRLLEIDEEPVRMVVEAERSVDAVERDGTLLFRVDRNGERVDCPVRPVWVGGVDAVDYYLLLVALTFLGVGLIVWLRATRARAAVPFALHCQAMFLYLVHKPTGRGGMLDLATYWGDLAGLLLAPALFVHINLALTDDDRGAAGRRLRRAALYLPPFLLFLINLTLIAFEGAYRFDDPVAAIRLKERLEQLYVAVYLIAGIVMAVRSFVAAEKLQTRWQLKWMAWGSVCGFLPPALLYLAPLSLGVRIGHWSQLSVLPMALVPLSFAAAVVRYRLLDLDLFLKRGTVAIGLLLSFASAYAACYVVMDRMAGGASRPGFNVALIGATLMMVIFYPRLHRRLRAWVDQFFYRERHDFRRTLVEFGAALNRELSLPALVTRIEGRIERTFNAAAVRVLVRDRDGALFSDGAGTLAAEDPLVGLLAGVDWLSLRDHPGALDLPSGARLLEESGVEYLFPLLVEGEILAIVGVAPPRDGVPFTSEDLQLLVSFGGHAAVAIAGARLYSALAEKVSEIESLREFNESILESSRVAILVLDPEGRVAGVNRAFEALSGTPRAHLAGRPVAEALPARAARGLPACGEEGARLDRAPWRSADGTSAIVNLTRSPLRDGRGRLLGTVVTLDDVTDQVRREEDLQRREHLASIGLLASGVAHEVNTPLTGISSYAQMLLQGRNQDDPAYPLLRKIQQQTERASGIASSLLNFARQADGDYQPVDVGDMAQETLQLFEPHLKGRRIELHRHIEPSLPAVTGNRGRLQQVLMNLLLNAADATPDGGAIAVRATSSSGRIRLTVSDTGVGIPAEHLDRIYDPFFTTKPRGRGTGLGLSVSYGIVKEHAGTLIAESAPGEGSRFVISLPVIEAGVRRVTA
ncbi:MAG TPA: ATP-binding protein [Candidatus Polarisedimenticolia bacterium]|nr:ATP-binding protein [Candidatus Polarisedimenticolia bacterium]